MTLNKRQLRYRAKYRAEPRSLTLVDLAKWLLRNSIPAHVEETRRGHRILVAYPELPVDRVALRKYGFSVRAADKAMTRNCG